MKTRTIRWHDEKCKIIDQTLLPTCFKEIVISTPEQMFEAIQMLKVRGAPAIGIAAAFGIYLGIRKSNFKTADDLRRKVKKVGAYLARSRPTAVNLFWAIDRIIGFVEKLQEKSPEKIRQLVLRECKKMIEEDDAVCRRIGEFGSTLLSNGSTILTHCNAGSLATASYGTALAPVYVAKEQGKSIRVFADETRPLLQGARLTAWELTRNGIDTTLICDNMAASVMAKGWIDLVIVGTDRVAANGDFANKIGTYGVAVLAKTHRIPFYVAAPFSSIDPLLRSGKEIPIEERDGDEVACGFGKRTAPKNVAIYNPAFDVTPARYVTGFITEKGIFRPPFSFRKKRP